MDLQRPIISLLQPPEIEADDVKEQRRVTIALNLTALIAKAAALAYGYDRSVKGAEKEAIKLKDQMALDKSFYEQIETLLRSAIVPLRHAAKLFVAIDGAAPLARVQQERLMQQNARKYDYFDPMRIHPGGAQYASVEEFVQNWISKNRQLLPETVISSWSILPSSASLKIVQWLKREENDGTTVIIPYMEIPLLRALLSVNNLGPTFWPAEGRRSQGYYRLSDLQERLRNRVGENGITTFVLGLSFFGIEGGSLPPLIEFGNTDLALQRLCVEIKAESLNVWHEGRLVWKDLMKLLARLSVQQKSLLAELSTKILYSLYRNAIKNNDVDINMFRSSYYDRAIKAEKVTTKRPDFIKEVVYDYLSVLALDMNAQMVGEPTLNQELSYRHYYAPLLNDLVDVGKQIVRQIAMEDLPWQPKQSQLSRREVISLSSYGDLVQGIVSRNVANAVPILDTDGWPKERPIVIYPFLDEKQVVWQDISDLSLEPSFVEPKSSSDDQRLPMWQRYLF